MTKEAHSHGQEHGQEHGHEHGHHHADDVFTSWGVQTSRAFDDEELKSILSELMDSGRYGNILRAKGIVRSVDGIWIHFDYVPGEPDIRRGSADVTGRICVIGAQINEAELKKLFN